MEDRLGLGQRKTRTRSPGKGHLWVGGDGELGESLGCLRLPHVGAFRASGSRACGMGPSASGVPPGP